MGWRKQISSVLISKRARAPQIGAVGHRAGGHSTSARRNEAHDKNEALKVVTHALETILETGLARDAHVGVGDWKREPTLADLPAELRDLAAPDPEQFKAEPLGILERLSPDARARHADAVQAGEVRYRKAVADWEQAQARQAKALADLRIEVEAQNNRFTELERSLKAGDPASVEWYAAEVLTRSPYPKRLERRVEVGFDNRTGTLKVRLGVPPASHVVPAPEAFKYIRATDEVQEVDRSPEERAALYDRVLAQLVLRSLHEIFSTDTSGMISSVALALDLVGVDPSTGHDEISPLLSVAVDRPLFTAIDLTRVDPIACLHRLTKQAS